MGRDFEAERCVSVSAWFVNVSQTDLTIHLCPPFDIILIRSDNTTMTTKYKANDRQQL